jgi:CHAT domain
MSRDGARIRVGGNVGTVVGRDVRLGPGPPPGHTRREERKPAGILMLGANATESAYLRLSAEAREIDQALRLGRFRDAFVLDYQLALRVADLQDSLLRFVPQILHFSGHGSAQVLCFEDDAGTCRPVSGAAFAGTLGEFSQCLRCVVLNSCHSQEQASAILQSIDCVVAMGGAISDDAARGFSAAFYRALADGRSVKTAFDLGQRRLDLEGVGDADLPRLISARSDPARMTFAR